jgi:hypothetical protein
MIVSALALILMDKRAMDPTPAYVAAWAITLAVSGLFLGLVYLIVNGG